MKFLFLDDVRIPGDVTWIQLDNVKWEIVRSYSSAIRWVHDNGFPDVISVDHDLGYEEVDTSYLDSSGLLIPIVETEEKTGYDFAKFLIDLDIDTNSMPDEFRFTVHSKNPIGSENIRELLNNYIRFRKTS